MPDYFFARQGVLDSAKAIFGYELLFRNDYQNSFNAANGDQATLEVLSNALFHTTFEQMVGGKHGLVNFTQELLFSDVAFLFSPEHLIIEVLETVVPDGNVVEACKRLKAAGFKIALDQETLRGARNQSHTRKLLQYEVGFEINFGKFEGEFPTVTNCLVNNETDIKSKRVSGLNHEL